MVYGMLGGAFVFLLNIIDDSSLFMICPGQSSYRYSAYCRWAAFHQLSRV